MTQSSTTHLVGVAIPTLRELRSAVLASSTPEAAVTALREAGFAGGEAVYAAFEQWLAESGATDGSSGKADAGELTLEDFGEGTANFFRDAGWGEVAFSRDDDEGVAIVDIVNCWEATGGGAAAGRGCHITTGLLSAFFGRIAGYPVAVLETECCDGEASRCRFLMGNAEMMNYKWEEMESR
jgi:predicted hydrocarbon binding protein